MSALQARLFELEEEIKRAEEEISKVVKKLEPLDDKEEAKTLDVDDRTRLGAFREKEKYLRKKEEQLRKKEEQLRDERLLLLQGGASNGVLISVLQKLSLAMGAVDQKVERLSKNTLNHSRSDAQVGSELLTSLKSQGRFMFFSGEGDSVFSNNELLELLACNKEEDLVKLVTPAALRTSEVACKWANDFGEQRTGCVDRDTWGKRLFSKARFVCMFWVFLQAGRHFL